MRLFKKKPDNGINVAEREHEDETLESCSSITMTPLNDDDEEENASTATHDTTVDNEKPNTPWIVANTNVTD